MNREESIKLLALIKVAYPTAYKDMDNASKQATVNMWHSTFTDMPYPIMEMAFNHFRLKSKFPPTVAEMAEELKGLYYEALQGAMYAKSFGSEEDMICCQRIMQYTDAYKSGEYLNHSIERSIGMLGSKGLPALEEST